MQRPHSRQFSLSRLLKILESLREGASKKMRADWYAPRMFKKAAQRGRRERRPRGVLNKYVEGSARPRTKLEVFFDILPEPTRCCPPC